MQVESGASPLLTEVKTSSLPGQFCPFHPHSTLELIEKAQGFCYVYCSEKKCFMLAPASEWKEDVETWRLFFEILPFECYNEVSNMRLLVRDKARFRRRSTHVTNLNE